jgi:hypothetical protein
MPVLEIPYIPVVAVSPNCRFELPVPVVQSVPELSDIVQPAFRNQKLALTGLLVQRPFSVIESFLFIVDKFACPIPLIIVKIPNVNISIGIFILAMALQGIIQETTKVSIPADIFEFAKASLFALFPSAIIDVIGLFVSDSTLAIKKPAQAFSLVVNAFWVLRG